MRMELNHIYLHSERIGYGYMGTRQSAALSGLGVDVYDTMPGIGDLNASAKRSKICKNILFSTVPTHITGWYNAQRPHLFTMWETTEIPEAMRDTLHNFVTVMVPSDANRELFSRYHDNVHVVPLGVDSQRWTYVARRDDIYFNFLVAGSGERKGTDLVFRAFMELFGNWSGTGRIPRLLMKNPKGENYSGSNVEVLPGYMTPEDEVALYASAHCYVQPSRGEGWGLQPLQAIAQGCPTILTNAHGHEAFARYAIPIPATFAPAKYMAMYGDCGNWWEPDYDALKGQMADVYETYEYHRDRAMLNSTVVRDLFSWENSARDIVSVIGEDRLRERFHLPEVPTEFVVPDQKLYRVIVSRDWKADIGGVTHLLTKGVEYWKPADVKRVLFEGGVLDPVCLDDPDGLTADQLQRLGLYLDQHSRCPTCGQVVPNEEDEEVSV